MGQEQVLEASLCCSQDIRMGLIWGTDRDVEMEKREMGGASSSAEGNHPGALGCPSLLRPGLPVGLVSSPEQAVSTPRAGRQE